MYVNIYVCSFWVEKKNGIDDLGVRVLYMLNEVNFGLFDFIFK